MLEIRDCTVFRKDLKRVIAQGKNYELFRALVLSLANQDPIDRKHKDHLLKNNWKGFRELHIQPNWLLIYRVVDQVLHLARTGSHSELFG